MDLWLYPGALLEVNAPTKVTLTPAAIGEVPAAGATIIPPQHPVTAHAALMQKVANDAHQAVVLAATQANDAVKAAAETIVTPTILPPWSVTFTEKQ